MGVFTSSLTLCLTLASVGINCLSIPDTVADSSEKAPVEIRQAAAAPVAANWTGPYGDSNLPGTFTFMLALPNSIINQYPIDGGNFIGFSTFTQNGDSWTIHGTRQATQPPRVVYEWGTQLACDTKHPSYYLTPDQTGTKYGFNVTTGVDHFGGPCWYREYGTNTLDDLIVYYADQEYTFPWQTEAGSNPQGGPPRCRFLPGTLSPYTLSPSPPPPNPLPNYAVNHGQWAIYCTCLNNP